MVRRFVHEYSSDNDGAIGAEAMHDKSFATSIVTTAQWEKKSLWTQMSRIKDNNHTLLSWMPSMDNDLHRRRVQKGCEGFVMTNEWGEPTASYDEPVEFMN